MAGQDKRHQKIEETKARAHYADQKERLRERGRQSGAQVRDQARSYANEVRNMGASLLDEQKENAAQQVHGLGAVFHDAARKLRDEEDPALANYADMAANQLDGVGDYLRQRDLQEMVADAQDFARLHPFAVAGGMFLAGLAAGRFLRAKPPERRRTSAADYDDLESGDMGDDEPYTPPANPPSTLATAPADQPRF